MLCLFCKKAYRELNLKRALDEDTGVFSFLSSSSPHVNHNILEHGILDCSCIPMSMYLFPTLQVGAHGKPVVFLHPKDCNGVLVELEQK